MSPAEFMRWHAFHQVSPIDDHSLHLKTAALIAHAVVAAQGGDKAPSVEKFLQYLAPTPDECEELGIFEQLKRRALRDDPAPG